MSAGSGRVAVVGGGIGGLAAATALAQRGFEIELFERQKRFESPGVGLGQPANALRALDAIGVLEEVLDAGFVFEHFKFFDDRAQLLVDHRFRLGGGRIPACAALPRESLHRILREAAAAAGVRLRMGSKVDEVVQDGARAQLAVGGRVDAFDVVVGFDGYRSRVRRATFPDAPGPAYSGFAAWRLIVARPSSVQSMQVYQGMGSKTGVMPLTDTTMYLFHIRPEADSRRQNGTRMPELLRERLAGYSGVPGEVREALSDRDQIVFSPIEPLMVPPPWHRGSIVLGGDAAHTYAPHATQGAAMALEDGIVLAEELSREGPLAARLESYGRRRLPRCMFVQQFARRMLLDEQDIKTQEQLEAAREVMFDGLDERLTAADRYLDRPAFGAGVLGRAGEAVAPGARGG